MQAVSQHTGKRTANRNRQKRWRAKHIVRAKLRAQSQDEEQRRRKGRADFQAGHRHRCIKPECLRRYDCTNACDPQSLDDSLCPPCFEKERHPV